MSVRFVLTMVFALLILGSGLVHADGDGDGKRYIEATVGIGWAKSDARVTNWDNVGRAKNHVFGVRGGLALSRGSPIEIEITSQLRHTDVFDWDVGDTTDIRDQSVYRLRVLAGARLWLMRRADVRLFARAGVGVDRIAAAVELSYGLGDANEREQDSDLGLALDLGFGGTIPVGDFDFGLQIGLPIAFHNGGKVFKDRALYDLDYTAFDVDLIVSAGYRF